MNPLTNKRIVNTRAAHQAVALNTLLLERDAVPLDYPCIAIIPPDDNVLLDTALHDLAQKRYDWLMLTSANTVYILMQRLNALGLTVKDAAFRTAAVGTASLEAAQQHGLKVDFVPPEYHAAALAQTLSIQAGERVLLPHSALAPSTLADGLTARGAAVTTLTAYQTIRGSGGANVPALLAQKQIDAVTFTSASTVMYFLERLSLEGGHRDDLENICIACIGRQTAAAAREHGLNASVVAIDQTLAGLIQAIEVYFTQG